MSGLTVEALTDTGAPQVGLTIDGLDAGATSVVSVDVTWDGGESWRGVRGAQRLAVVGGTFVRDYVPPLNVTARYRLSVHSGAVVPTQLEATVRIDDARSWLQDPLNPRTAVAVRTSRGAHGDPVLLVGSLTSAVWEQAVDQVVPQGASMPVASVGQRVLAGDVPLVVSHDVAAEGGALRRLLLSTGQLVVRGLPADLLEPVAHIVVGAARETRSGPDMQVSTWDLTAQQTRPQSLRVVVPWWTYDQVRAMWQGRTYDQAKAARPGDTYLDWLRNPEVP